MTFGEMQAQYPWELKLNSAIWRGSTTGPRDTHWRELSRTKLVLLSKNYSDIFDAGFTAIVQNGWDQQPQTVKEIRQESRVVKMIHREEFMKHKAIVDIDGNSWSSRFGTLLCSNSVVIKVAPESVDYWYGELTPWVHFLPVHKNLTNLVDQIRYAVDANNDAKMRAMVNAANEWCRHKMTVTQFSVDMLWILGNYLDVLQSAYSHDGVSGSINTWLSQLRNLTDENLFEIASPNPTLLQ